MLQLLYHLLQVKPAPKLHVFMTLWSIFTVMSLVFYMNERSEQVIYKLIHRINVILLVKQLLSASGFFVFSAD